MDNVYIKKEDLNKWVAKFFNEDLITIEDLISAIEELDEEIGSLKDKIRDLEYELENQEEPITDYYDYYGVSRND